MTDTEFKFERLTDSDIIIKRFDSPDGGYVALAWDEIGEKPYLYLKHHDGRSFCSFHEIDTWKFGDELSGFLDASEDFNVLIPQAHKALQLHAQIRISHDADDANRTGYDYLQYRPHIKVAVKDVTGGYAESWLSNHGVMRVEEIWFYDDSRRTHICSFTPSIEAWAVSERIAEMRGETEFGELTPEMEIQRDRAEGELAGFEHWIDYFGGLGCDYDAGPASDQEVFDLMTGEMTYEEYMEVWRDYFRSNEVA